jgi:hypothetical protein
MTATTIENGEYGVRSDEVAPVRGVPVVINTSRIYFPLILIPKP